MISQKYKKKKVKWGKILTDRNMLEPTGPVFSDFTVPL